MSIDETPGGGPAAPAIAPLAKPPAPGPLRETLIFAWRALLKIKHTPEQLFDVVVTPVMFTVIFTYLFGGALVGSPDAYLQFLLPGILVQTVMFTSVYTGFTLNTDLSKGIFDRFRSLPIWRPAPIAGAVAGDLLRYTISSVLVILVGAVMGYRAESGLPGLLAAILVLDVFAFGIGWVFMAAALLVRTPGTVMTLSWLVLMPLTFASNVYVDPATLPDWLRAFVEVNPVALAVTALRGILGGTPDAAEIGLALAAPAVVAAVFAPLTMRLYARER
ncbi:ABC transporter permease [Arenibaculum sp.]|jgi:ABC-2 type transport system permease protein|uniref:ABC transporter permease n=1 Tax=Arenibaculum sp. TaxID=2865862 RepID=UPI002E154A21|nr:ABC transporter permease [Arenibaculum sp.]